MPGMQTENGAEIRGSRRPDEGSTVFDFNKKAASREAAGKKRRSETPEADLKHLDRIRLMELILDRSFGKAEATVNVNGGAGNFEASEMRIEALVRKISLEGNPYGEDDVDS